MFQLHKRGLALLSFLILVGACRMPSSVQPPVPLDTLAPPTTFEAQTPSDDTATWWMGTGVQPCPEGGEWWWQGPDMKASDSTVICTLYVRRDSIVYVHVPVHECEEVVVYVEKPSTPGAAQPLWHILLTGLLGGLAIILIAMTNNKR